MLPPNDNALTLEEMGAASLASLDASAGKARPDLAAMASPNAWALEKWYAAVYDTPFGQYSEEDFSRICVQDWEREHIVPLALARLQNEPFCGGRYNGDVLFNIGSTSMLYWEQHPEQRDTYCQILRHVLSLLQEPDEDGEYETEDKNGYSVFLDANDYRNILDLQARLCRKG